MQTISLLIILFYLPSCYRHQTRLKKSAWQVKVMALKSIKMLQQRRSCGLKVGKYPYHASCGIRDRLTLKSLHFLFFSDVDYNYLPRVLMWIIIIFDVNRDDNYGQLCLYLTLIMCIFAF